jgi:hypothetical protein
MEKLKKHNAQKDMKSQIKVNFMELEMDALAQVVSMLKLTTEDVPIS